MSWGVEGSGQPWRTSYSTSNFPLKIIKNSQPSANFAGELAMLRRRLSWALGASLVSGASALCVARSRPASTVPLASTVCQPLLPTTVLVHGLDSSKETW